MMSIGSFARLGEVSPRMLRHYDEIGLLSPAHVDAESGYRWYAFAQLARLHRLMALRDLGFSLEQITAMLTDEPSVEQLRGMLRLRRSQVERTIEQDLARLRRIEAHLAAVERTHNVSTLDVAIKRSQPLRILQASATAPGPGPAKVGPVFRALAAQVVSALRRNGVEPGMSIGRYEDLGEDGSMVVHVGIEISPTASISDFDGLCIVDLPVVSVASIIHHGRLDTLMESNQQLAHWIQDSGHTMAGPSRELYLLFDEHEPQLNITEIQALLTG